MASHPENEAVSARVFPHPDDQELTGPIIVACHWNMLSPVGPALHDEGGSRPRSINSCMPGVNDPGSRPGVLLGWIRAATDLVNAL